MTYNRLQDAGQTEALWDRTLALGERLFAASRPFRIENLIEDASAQTRVIAAYAEAYARIIAICCAYSTFFLKVSPASLPRDAAFTAFRQRVLAEIAQRLGYVDWLDEQIGDLPSDETMSSPAEHADRLLREADDRRLQAESEENIVSLATPMVKNRSDIDDQDKEDIVIALMDVMLSDFKERLANPSMATVRTQVSQMAPQGGAKPKRGFWKWYFDTGLVAGPICGLLVFIISLMGQIDRYGFARISAGNLISDMLIAAVVSLVSVVLWAPLIVLLAFALLGWIMIWLKAAP